MKQALIIIDMQNGFLNPESPLCIRDARATVPACAKVIYLLREKREFWQCFPKVFKLFYCGAKSGLVFGAKKQETFS